MKRILTQTLLVVAALLTSSLSARAGGRDSEDLLQSLTRADAVCVIKVGDIHVGGLAEFGDGVYSAPAGSSYDAPAYEGHLSARRAVASCVVERFLKGGASSSSTIEIVFPSQFQPKPGGNTWYPTTELVSGERILVFLKRTPEDADEAVGFYQLFAPFSVAVHSSRPDLPGPKIILTDAPLPDFPASATPLRKTLLVLAAMLAAKPAPEQKDDRRFDYLLRNANVGRLLALPADDNGRRSALPLMKQERSALGESEHSDLDGFVLNQVLPVVEKLVRSEDAALQQQAVVTAAALQDPDVLPKLASIVEQIDPKTHVAKSAEAGNAASALSQYRRVAAVPGLCRLLKNPSGVVRENAAQALRYIGDPRSVPSLLDDLDDSDPRARYMVVSALYMAAKVDGGVFGSSVFE